MPVAHCGGSNDDHVVSGNHNPNLQNNRPPSTDSNRHHGSHDPNSSQPSTSPPVVPAKVLTKPRPTEQSGGGSSSSRSSGTSSTPRSDPESPKSDYVVVDGNVDDNSCADSERPSGTRSRAQSITSGSTPTVRMVATSSGNQTEGGPLPKNLADNTISSYSDATRGPRKPPPAAGAGEYTEPGVTGNKHQHQYQHQPQHQPQHHSSATVAVSNVNVNVQHGGVHDPQMPGGHPQTVQEPGDHPDGSSGGGFGSGIVRYLMPNPSPQTPRDREMDRLKADLKKRNADLENYQREVKRLQRDMKSHVTSINILQTDRAKLTDANNNMHYELINVKKQLEEIKALADIRGKELLGAQKFLTKADSISISDLKEKVVALNDEIFQAAASLGETITHHPHEMTEEDASRMYGEVLQLLGDHIGNLLVAEGQKPNADPNPLLVQVVLQVFMTQVCASKVELWVPNDPKISDFFATVYNNIQSAEEPAVSGRWRALTQTHTRPITKGWKEDLISSLMKIIKLAAWKMPDKEQRLSFEGKLVPIFKAVEDLRIAIGEKITSADIRVSLVPPLSQFDASWMDDAFADVRVKTAPTGPVQCVVGTTGFGLKKVIINGQRGASGELLYESVLSPKVILESTLKEALNPPPRQPKPGRKPTAPAGGRNTGGPNSRRKDNDPQGGGEVDLK